MSDGPYGRSRFVEAQAWCYARVLTGTFFVQISRISA
jgi:hypothetical protein